jgi:hypothetical protein
VTHDTELAAARGDFHFPIESAAICAEADCGRVFAIEVRSSSDGAHRCPACGGAHFIMIDAALKAGGESRELLVQRIVKLEDAMLKILGAYDLFLDRPRPVRKVELERNLRRTIDDAKELFKEEGD